MSRIRAAPALKRVRDAIPPGSGAMVMATGIVSTALASDREHVLALALLAIAAAAWLALGLLLADRMFFDRRRVLREARSPAALTSVAATAVLGARATGIGTSGAAVALLVIAAGLWLLLLGPVLAHRGRRVPGVAFMATVSTQSLAVLAAQLALRDRAGWLLYPSLATLVLGLALYAFVLAKFDFRQLLDGAGDHWVSGGALAISTLAVARITIGVEHLHRLAGASGSLQTVAVVLWALALAWLPVLVAVEVIRPRLHYDVRRWATVFPLGMYAACSFDAGRAAHLPGLTDFARVWAWFAFAVWLAVFAGMLWHGRAMLRVGKVDV
ncbi:MAG TPA: tellurite resistance/C4-dicarboxylate transporter family protein [Solirubrobacteraceae bacterium]|nr:tellurite resistance/C4-dicarboxylate transporter family protein [Solirubrobacteraceae bacterium]